MGKLYEKISYMHFLKLYFHTDPPCEDVVQRIALLDPQEEIHAGLPGYEEQFEPFPELRRAS